MVSDLYPYEATVNVQYACTHEQQEKLRYQSIEKAMAVDGKKIYVGDIWEWRRGVACEPCRRQMDDLVL